MATIQETIDNLISYIDAAVAKHSVSNRHVAAVLAFLNEGLKSLSSKYLSKIEDDTAGGFITFMKGLLSHGNIKVEGNSSIAGTQYVGKRLTLGDGFITEKYNNVAGQITGAQLTADGILSVAGLQAMTFEVFELIYNVIEAQGGRVEYSPTATIESCLYSMDENETIVYTPDEFYTSRIGALGQTWNDAVNAIHHIILTFKKTEENKSTVPFRNGDIIYGYVNQIGESGQYARGGQSVMSITTPDRPVDGDIESDYIGKGGSMTVRATLSPIGDVTKSYDYVLSNMPPTEQMVLAQRGNVRGIEGRTTAFFIDSIDGHILMLHNVQTPTISSANYGVIVGRLPTDLFLEVKKIFAQLQPTDPVSFAKYGIFQHLIHFDHLGNPIKSENNRGEWSLSTATDETTDDGKPKSESNSYLNRYKNEEDYYDTVTYDGEFYKCLSSDNTEVPSQGNCWLKLVSKGLSPNPNFLQNTNFDLCDGGGGMLKYWTTGAGLALTKDECVEIGISDGLNALKKTMGAGVNGGVVAQAKNKLILKAGTTYTLSCRTKYTGVVNGGTKSYMYGLALIIPYSQIDVISSENISKIAATGTTTTDIFFGKYTKSDEWVTHSMTFKPIEDINKDVTYKMYSWVGGITVYYSQMKLECGDKVTPYQKSLDDYNGQSVSISSTDIFYAKHDSGTTKPSDDKWQDTLPSVTDGNYLWTWTRVVYSTGQKTDSYSVSRVGIDGKGIKSAITKYCEKANTDKSPESFAESDWDDFPSNLTDGYFLYSRTITTYSDGSTAKSFSVTQNGQGSYYAGLQEYYAPSSSQSNAPSGYPANDNYPNGADMPITGTWREKMPELTEATPYLWNFSVSFDSKGNRYVTTPVCIGNFAKGIKSIIETYAISAFSTASKGSYPSDITSWSDEHQDAVPTEDKPYQWNKTETEYNDGSKHLVYHLSAVKGADGNDGLTPNPNILKNTNFDVLENDGCSLKYWYDSSGTVPLKREDVYLNSYQQAFNSYGKLINAGYWGRYFNPVIIEKGKVYTISCMVKHEGEVTGSQKKEAYGFILWNLPYDNIKVIKKEVYGVGRAGIGKMEIYFGGCPDWTKRSITFRLKTDEEAGEGVTINERYEASLRLYSWCSGIRVYLSQIKMEYGDTATPYCKNVDDYNGRDGRDSYNLTLSPSAMQITGDAATQKILSGNSQNIKVSLSTAAGVIPPDVYTIDITPSDELFISCSNKQKTDDGYSFSLSVTNGADSTRVRLCRCKVEAKIDGTLMAVSEVAFGISERGLVGDAGKAGIQGYFAGYLKLGVAYGDTYFKYNSKGEVITTPILYYLPSDATRGTYYQLMKPITARKNTEANLGDTEYWEPFEHIENLFVDMLMANWAKFGSANGGIFYDRYLFSQDGINRSGQIDSFNNYQVGDTSMFDNEGTNEDPKYRLNGKFSPNLFLDFLRGAIKTNRMSETFKEFEYISKDTSNETYGNDKHDAGSMLMTPCNILDTDDSYNISIEPNNETRWAYASNTGANKALDIDGSSLLLSMPLINDIKRVNNVLVNKAPWEPDGMKVTILVRQNEKWNEQLHYVENDRYESGLFEKPLTSGVVLCADARVIDQRSYKVPPTEKVVRFSPGEYNTNGESVDTAKYGGFFVVKGHITKFLLVEPGMMVRLRSCTQLVGIGGGVGSKTFPLWYVENSDDFAEVEAEVDFSVSYVDDGASMASVGDGFTGGGYDDDGNFIYRWGTTEPNNGMKNVVYATNGIVKVNDFLFKKFDSNASKTIYIYTRKDKFYDKCEDNIYMIS